MLHDLPPQVLPLVPDPIIPWSLAGEGRGFKGSNRSETIDLFV